MKRCPITYEELIAGELYSKKGLHLLAKGLTHLEPLPWSAKEQVLLAISSANKLSIQGVQPKLSVMLRVSEGKFEPVEKNGTYILKPPHANFEQLPENEDVTMRMAKVVGIEVPLHGLLHNCDGSLTYFIKRFDRHPKRKISVEDFSQLLGYDRDTKYDASIEKAITAVEQNCSIPAIEQVKLFYRILFSFLVGNEDMHLKNFSLIRHGSLIQLSPAYDLLNSSIALRNPSEESALPIRGKKSKLMRADFIDYLAKERMRLSDANIQTALKRFAKARGEWERLIDQCFLDRPLKEAYLSVLADRFTRLQIP